MTALAIIIGVLVMAACLYLIALGKVSARADRTATRAHVDYQMRYVGGSRPCVICGEPTRYSLHGRPMHPGCREERS